MQGHGDMVIVAYRPKAGREETLARLVAEHVPSLRRWDLATDRPHLVMRATDGTVIEVFEWREGAVAAAHKDARVHGLWARFEEACTIIPLRDVAETAEMFATFVPVDAGAAAGSAESVPHLAGTNTAA